MGPWLSGKGEGGCTGRPSMMDVLDHPVTHFSGGEGLNRPSLTVEQIPEQVAQRKKRADQLQLDIQVLERVCDLIGQLEEQHRLYRDWTPLDSGPQRESRMRQITEREDQLRKDIVATAGFRALPWSSEYAQSELERVRRMRERLLDEASQMQSDDYRSDLAERWKAWDSRVPRLVADGSGRPGYYRVVDQNTGQALSGPLADYEVRKSWPQLYSQVGPDSSG